MDETDTKEIVFEKMENDMFHNKNETRYKYAFLFLIFFLIGFISGLYFARYVVIERYLKDATTIGGIIINSVPYDLKGR